ncbi:MULTISPECIES: hypothetical protein [unclassified Microbacterium]|uniref:hypothetical protein n=1 Tax=unclassified Microbacterium TaxID=2609290 RepID=UPI000CFBF2E2|nr:MULTISPECIES: hypothetical protein [unclassified Microbacterium]PQZ53145.1 hypothetical protein CQ032_15680 [Microbacterium sp. MYb43]PQZ74687.1 hypothetical protein CQ031_15025 [Microbacterium sp. MYb40]PRB18775.1 hypothetical protein CQ040_16330 [Microbacterium sp. MYb54]PRB23635.1 hypothetical protein CQ037_17130 [Microbacterium sp. MYb50]PRB63356.1 hypothetical protein CQ021_16775 [Microbacterium sp. MYb24]
MSIEAVYSEREAKPSRAARWLMVAIYVMAAATAVLAVVQWAERGWVQSGSDLVGIVVQTVYLVAIVGWYSMPRSTSEKLSASVLMVFATVGVLGVPPLASAVFEMLSRGSSPALLPA